MIRFVELETKRRFPRPHTKKDVPEGRLTCTHCGVVVQPEGGSLGTRP